MQEIIKLEHNRVWRTYLGGKLLNQFLEYNKNEDNHYPEMWIGSITEANNPEKTYQEGLSIIKSEFRDKKTLKETILSNPEYYLGKEHVTKYGSSLGILVKLLDSSERLTIQVHPDKNKALSLFNSQFGKTEAWIIQGGRVINGEAPHIFFGFKKGITKEIWRTAFNEQNIHEMLNLMNKIYVKPGDVFLIEGGMPHAIGAGCFILEIQEPTDLTIRTEKTTPDGYIIPDTLIHQGIGFENMFECFNYIGYSVADLEKWILKPKYSDSSNITQLISYNHTKCFSLEEINIKEITNLFNNNKFSLLIVMDGDGLINYQNKKIAIKKADQIFLSASLEKITITTKCKNLKIIRCLPPKS